MKKIKIFLASSITDLKIDRVEVGDFIRQLNDIYFDRGIRISLIKCDDYDNAIAAGGKQAEYDAEIRDSELCLFLFFKKVGDFTRHEFEIALDGFKNCKRPKIVTYFKYIETPEEATGEVKNFMQFLDGEIRHYYNVYQSIDTLKLGLLMQIKLMQLDTEEPKVENGKITFGGETIADTAKIPLFTGNDALTELKARLERLTKEYYSLREKYRGDPENDDLYAAYSKIASEKAATEQAVKNAEKAVLEAANGMYEQTAHPLSPRQTAAYRAFEQGNYRDALEILDLNEIMADLTHNEEMADGYRDRIQTNVNELLQRIKVMTADGIDKGEAEEIEKIYETAMQRIEKYDLEKTPICEYASFLQNQNEYGKAIEVAKQLEYYYLNPKNPASDEQKAILWNLLGNLYSDTQRYQEAEEVFRKSIEVYGRLSKQDPAAFERYLGGSYNNLAILYRKLKRFGEAEEKLNRALEICQLLTKRNVPDSESDLAKIYLNLGNVYGDLQRYAEAETAYQKALEICERLAKANPVAFEPDLAKLYTLFGTILRKENRYQEAERLFQKALELYEKLGKGNPAAHEPALATCYNNLGNLFLEVQRFAEAEEAHKKALGIRERIAKSDPAAFEPDVAQSYSNLAVLYRRSMRYSEAEAANQKAIALYEKLAKGNPAVFEPDLARDYHNFADFCISVKHFSEAETAYLKAAEIYERLAKSRPEVFEPDFVMLHCNLGILYANTQRYAEANEQLNKAFKIARKYPQNRNCIQVLKILAMFGIKDE